MTMRFWLRILSWESHPGLARWAQWNRRVLLSGRQEDQSQREDVRMGAGSREESRWHAAGFIGGRKVTRQGMQVTYDLEPPEGVSPANTRCQSI